MAEHQAMYATDEVRDLLSRTKTDRFDEVKSVRATVYHPP